MLDDKRRLDERGWNHVRYGKWFSGQIWRWKALLPGGLPDLLRFAPAKAGEALLLRRVGHSGCGQTYTQHADLGVILKGALFIFISPVGELPDPYLVIPFAPVRDHGTIPGGSGRDDRHHDAAGYEQFSGIGDDAVLRPFAVAKEVRRVGQHQAHRAGRAGGTLEGAGEDSSMRQASACYVSTIGADLHAIEPGCRQCLAGCQQIALACCGIKDGDHLSCWKGEQGVYDPLCEEWWRAYKC